MAMYLCLLAFPLMTMPIATTSISIYTRVLVGLDATKVTLLKVVNSKLQVCIYLYSDATTGLLARVDV